MNKSLYTSAIDLINFFKESQKDLRVLTHPKINYKVFHTEIIASSVSLHLLSIAMPILVLQVYDRIITNQSYGTLYSLFSALALALFLEFTLKLCRSYVLSYYSAALEHGFYSNTINQFVSSNFKKEGKNTQTSSYVQKIEDINRLKEVHSGQAYLSMIEIPFVLIYISLIIYLCGVLALIPITVVAITTHICLERSNRLVKVINEKNEVNKKRFHFIYESLDGIHTIKSLGTEHTIVNKYEDIVSEVSKLGYQETSIRNSIQNICAFSSNLMTVLIATLGSYIAIEGYLSLGTLIAGILLSSRIIQPVQRTINLWITIQTLKNSRDSLKSAFDQQSSQEEDQHGEEEEIDWTNNENEGRLVIENLYFKYSSAIDNVLKGINLNLYKGDSIAITGKLDAGKNTLVRLIAGIQQPSAGSVKINGYNPADFNSRQLLENIAILPEQGTIYSGTIRENLTNFGEVPFDKSLTIVKYLGLDDEINNLPMGYDTELQGGIADGIPPGLKQRIAIVRSLNYKPKIIVFNNADRHLDSIGYSHLIRLLGRLKRKIILIMITDDQNLINLANTVYELKAGELNIDNTYTNLNYRLNAQRKELAV